MKYRMLAPGPTPIPDRVLAAMNQAIVHHRTPVFEKVFAKCVAGLKWAMQTNYDVLMLSCSGSGAFEAAVVNFLSPGDTVINIGGGKFAERWGQMAKRFGCRVVEIDVVWGQAADPARIKQALEQNPEARAVFCVACETSTGVRHPYEAIGEIVRAHSNCLFFVDGITAVGVWDMSPERDHIDVLVASSQKAFMLPPGLSFLAVSDKAWGAHDRSSMPRYYFDLGKERKAQATKQTAFSPAVSLIMGLQESLAMMQEEGLPHIFARHQRMAAGTRQAMQALGLPLFAQLPADSVTSVCAPEGISSSAIYSGMRDDANLTIAGGQDQLKGKIFRIAHLGYFDELDIFTVLCALEVILHKLGYRQSEPGTAAKAAFETLKAGFLKNAL